MSEPARAELESQIARFFDLSSDAMAIADADGRLKRVNRAFRDLLGYPDEDLADRPYIEMVHPDDVDSARLIFDEALATGRPIQFEVRALRDTGEALWMLWTIKGVSDDGLVFGVGKDITERREAERREKEMLAAEMRRRQALEINDHVIQGLTIANYALEQGDTERAKRAAEDTLRSAQKITQRLLDQSGESMVIRPGDLVRGDAGSPRNGEA